MLITRQSPFTGINRTVDLPITEAQLNEYLNGTLIQDAFPDCTPEEREFFMTGITDSEWTDVFGEAE